MQNNRFSSPHISDSFFQAYNLIPVLSAEENVEFIMELQGKTKKKEKNAPMNCSEAVGSGRKRNPAGLLSSQEGSNKGQLLQGRLASKTEILVLADEPTANLDSRSAENLLEIMEKLNKDENITSISSTHDPRVVRKARRVITLRGWEGIE
ncbi:MAG: hypothetical protein MZV63_03735 [Marinilabiliales bacterium]|nr:hypothetical protein [Marinilabiliales bacterium]